MKVAQLGIILMLTFVEWHHMKWLAKDSCFDKSRLACHARNLVLMVLWEQDGLPLNAISYRLYLESNTLTPLVKRMEAMKMVTRKKSKDDARQTIVTLTEHGRALQQQAAIIPDCMADVLHKKGMTDEEFATMIPTLDHLIEVLSI